MADPRSPGVDRSSAALAADAPRWREVIRQRSVLLTLGVLMVIVGGIALGLAVLRQQILASEQRMLAALAAATAEQADATLVVAQTSLRAVADGLAHGLLVPGRPSAQATLRRRAAIGPMFGLMMVLDADGREIASSEDALNDARDHRALPYLAETLSDPPGTLRIGLPAKVPGVPRDVIPLTTRWVSEDGLSTGVVLLLADAEFLDGGFGRSRPSPDTSLGIYRRNGDPVSDGPGNDREQLLDASTVRQLWADPARGEPRPITDRPQPRLVVARPMQRSRLLVVVSRDEARVLQDWLNQARISGAFMALALLVAVVLSLRTAREQLWRRAGETALASERQRVLRIFDAAREGVWEWDAASRTTYLSPRMKELLGHPRDEPFPEGVAGRARLATYSPDAQALRAALIRGLRRRDADVVFTLRVQTPPDAPSAAPRWVRLRGHFQRNARGRLTRLNGTGYDVTDEVAANEQSRRKDEQLQRAMRLEALGKLAGGVAHDFNNVLAAVLGYGERARQRLARDEAGAADLDQVLHAGRRGKALVERVLAFSRGGRRTQEPFHAQPVIEEVLAMLQGLLPPQVQLRSTLEAPQAVLQGDSTGLFEATLNLCVNGLQALEGAGVLEVSLKTFESATSRPVWQNTLPPGRWLRLTVRDNGTGIAEAVLPHLFEPFFSTRPPHEGTGLGLAIVHGVVHDFGGSIDIETAPGQGTRFELFLPLADATVASQVCADAHMPRGHGQVVLLLEDEPALRSLLEEQLAELGYEPRGFAHVDAAQAAFEADPEAFDLMLSDQAMPGRSGTDWARSVVSRRPDLPIIILTGFGGEDFDQRAQAAGVSLVVYKPLGMAELARAIDRTLARRPVGRV